MPDKLSLVLESLDDDDSLRNQLLFIGILLAELLKDDCGKKDSRRNFELCLCVMLHWK